MPRTARSVVFLLVSLGCGGPVLEARDGLVMVAPSGGAALTLQTTEIARDTVFDLGTGQTTALGGDLFIDRGIAEEQLLSNDDYIEHAWIFDQRPTGSGDLIVRVAVDGQAYAGWNES